MRICVKLRGLATVQKIMGYAMVIMAAQSQQEMFSIAFGVAVGILISEMSDVWYKLVCKCEQ